MKHAGFRAKITFDSDQKIFKGVVINAMGVLPFFGSSVEELESEFRKVVDDYAKECLLKGRKKQNRFNGNMLIKISPQLHERIMDVSIKLEMKMAEFIRKAILKELKKHESEEYEDESANDSELFD